MLLENNYYRIIDRHSDGMSAVYRIAFCPVAMSIAGIFPAVRYVPAFVTSG